VDVPRDQVETLKSVQGRIDIRYKKTYSEKCSPHIIGCRCNMVDAVPSEARKVTDLLDFLVFLLQL
jgi:hypothetical protein